MKKLLLVTGSRVIADTETGTSWAKAVLDEAIRSFAPTIVMAGGARGPDTWAMESAKAQGVTRIEFKLNGVRYENGEPSKLWSRDDPRTKDPKTWPLDRNLAMLDAASKAKEAGWHVRVLALCSRAPETAGTQHTASHAELRDLETVRRTLEDEVDTRPDVVWFDTETGGLKASDHALIEIGAIRTDASHRKVLDRFEIKMWPHPGFRIEPQAAQVNGYSEARWSAAGAVDAVEGLRRFLAWLPKNFTTAGYNVPFDVGFVTHHASAHRLELPVFRKPYVDPKEVVRATLQKRGVVRDARLDTACEHFGIRSNDAHQALADAERARLVHLSLLGKEALGFAVDLTRSASVASGAGQ